jgi:putative transposase
LNKAGSFWFGQTPQRSLRPRLLQAEFPDLKQRYWDNQFWAIGYGAWSMGNITDEMVQEYLEHHRNPSNKDS